jgi:hypothetical protein
MNPAGLRYTKEAATLVDQIVYGAIPIGPFAEVVQHFFPAARRHAVQRSTAVGVGAAVVSTAAYRCAVNRAAYVD